MAVYSHARSFFRSTLLNADPPLGMTGWQWEGRQYEPDHNDWWAKESMVVANSALRTLGLSGYTSDALVYSLNCHVPKGTRLSELEDLADRIVYLFPIGSAIKGTEGACGEVTNSFRRGVVEGDVWLSLMVSIGGYMKRYTHVNPA